MPAELRATWKTSRIERPTMSLINDALKKAARQRAEEQGDVALMPGGGRSSRQGQPMRKQTLVLIIAAAVALVVVSVVVTGILMAGKPPAVVASVAKPAPEQAVQDAPARVVVQAPVIAVSLPAVAAPVEPAKPSPTPAPVAVAPVAVAAAAPAPLPAAPDSKAAATAQSHADAVQAIVDAFHISGVRTAGAGSKALVDGHIYKLNDVVDKSVGLKLVKVDEDHLTFVDREGNTFVRSF
jgi:hypothetical protein